MDGVVARVRRVHLGQLNAIQHFHYGAKTCHVEVAGRRVNRFAIPIVVLCGITSKGCYRLEREKEEPTDGGIIQSNAVLRISCLALLSFRIVNVSVRLHTASHRLQYLILVR